MLSFKKFSFLKPYWRAVFPVELTAPDYHYRTIFDHSPIGIVQLNQEYRFISTNAAFCSLVGYSEDELLSKSIFDLLPDEDKNDILSPSDGLAPKPLSLNRTEKRLIHKNGTLLWVLISSRSILHENCKDTILFSTIEDITERKRMETELRLAASVFLNSYDGIIISNSENIIIDVNPSFVRITGYERSEVIGQTPRIFASGLHQKEFYRKLWDSLNKYDFWSGEIWNRRKNGEIYPQLLSITTVKNHHNKIQHYVALYSDISEFKKNETKLIEAKQQAEAATLAKSQFLATMSHEIRTPMNGVLGMAQILKLPNISEEERLEYAEIIIKSGNVLLTLLNDILDLSKVEAGKIVLDQAITHPKQLMEDTQKLFSEIARQKSLDLFAEWLGPANEYYVSDPHRIRQMLSNLINNAIKFTEHGQIQIESRVLKRLENSAVLEFSVTDSGIGIPQEKLPQLFKPFSQLDNAIHRTHGGTGLGLSIVASLAKLMGGACGVTSSPNHGSRFWFSIRAELASQEQIQRYSPHDKNHLNSLSMVREIRGRVLVVDDDEINQKVIDKFLSRFGVEVTIAENGHQAFDLLLHGRQFDLILMDLQMPIMDGSVTTRQIRRWELDENILIKNKIVAFTADAYEETKKTCLADGMDDVITKPVTITSLQNILLKFLSQKGTTSS